MKEYKINLHSYLNKRARPIQVSFENEDALAYPLYQKVTFKRQSTHFRSRISANSEDYTNHFTSLDETNLLFGNAQNTIKRDIQITEDIIRYQEKVDKNFKIAGFKELYIKYTPGIHIMINSRLNEYLEQKLMKKLDRNIGNLLNFEYGTFYSIFKYIDILFKHLDLFTKSEIEALELMRKFFILYNPANSKSNGNLTHFFYVPNDPFKNPLYIDLFSGRLENELTEFGLINSQSSEMLNTISMVLNLRSDEEL